MNLPPLPPNPIAQALGRMARGVPKVITEEERDRRRVRAAHARACRLEKLAAQKLPLTPTNLNVESTP